MGTGMRIARSIAGILAAIAINVALCTAIDQIFHILEVYPPWTEPMNETSDNVLALSYRLVITVFAGVIGLRIAGYAPGWHALALGVIGTGLGTLGAIVTTTGGADFGPDWYPWSLAVTAPFCTWLSYVIAKRRVGA